jgi:hypothetical protein
MNPNTNSVGMGALNNLCDCDCGGMQIVGSFGSFPSSAATTTAISLNYHIIL